MNRPLGIQDLENRENPDLAGVNLGVKAGGENTLQIPLDTATRDMGDAVQTFEPEERTEVLVIAFMGTQEAIQETLTINVRPQQRGVSIKKGSHQGIAVGVESIGCHREHAVASLYARTVNDAGPLHHPDNTRTQQIQTRLEDAGLFRGFAPD
jgi:hypothetical protein